MSTKDALSQAQTLAQRGQAAKARALYGAILVKHPFEPAAAKALTAMARASRTPKHPPQERLKRLVVLHQKGQLGKMAKEIGALIAHHPASFVLWNMLGAAHKSASELSAAESCLRKALTLEPRFADAHNNLGLTLRALGRLDEALQCYGRALKINPDYAVALSNLAVVLSDLGRPHEAIEACQKALAIAPKHVDAINNLGKALLDCHDYPAAQAAFEAGLKIAPKVPELHRNLASALLSSGHKDAALDACDRAIALRPEDADAHVMRGNILREQKDLPGAIAAFDAAVACAPKHGPANVMALHLRKKICDWSAQDRIAAFCEAGHTFDGVSSPFPALHLEDNAQRQLDRAHAWARRNFRGKAGEVPAPPTTRPGRLKIGLFSADFRNFPGMFSMIGLLEMLDRDRFELIAYSNGPDVRDAMRERIEAAVDNFIDIRVKSDAEVRAMAHAEGLHIAIHRNGYTQNGRTSMFQGRLAPVQISYLGYPSTLATDFIEYFIGDATVIPEDLRCGFAENVIFLPDVYLPQDDRRPVAPDAGSRADHGLPEKGFVFCGFNNSQKLGPAEFDIWCRLLDQVDGSVLWLLASNPFAVENLRNEAKARGIDPDRLVFAERLEQAEHLARQVHADLFVDTFHYNAHTTATDALWVGLPVVTMAGEQFAARVAASCLVAAGFPELITHTPADYEALILDLARDPARLRALRDRMQGEIRTSALFDTARYTRAFERAMDAAYDRYLEGKAPADIKIT